MIKTLNKLTMNYHQLTNHAIQIGLKTISFLIPFFVGQLLATLLLTYLATSVNLTAATHTQILTTGIGAYLGIFAAHYYSLGSFPCEPLQKTTLTLQIASMIGIAFGSFMTTLVYAFITS